MHRAVAKKKFLHWKWAKKNSDRLKIPPPPHHFTNGPSLKGTPSFVRYYEMPAFREYWFLSKALLGDIALQRARFSCFVFVGRLQ